MKCDSSHPVSKKTKPDEVTWNDAKGYESVERPAETQRDGIGIHDGESKGKAPKEHHYQPSSGKFKCGRGPPRGRTYSGGTKLIPGGFDLCPNPCKLAQPVTVKAGEGGNSFEAPPSQSITWAKTWASIIMLKVRNDEIKSILVWLRFYNFPFEFWDEEGLSQIANKVDKTFEGEESKVLVEYQMLPSSCTHCKTIGHEVKDCTLIPKVDPQPKGIQKVGNWDKVMRDPANGNVSLGLNEDSPMIISGGDNVDPEEAEEVETTWQTTSITIQGKTQTKENV
ncbi:hypothetical protein Acr_11g0011030 [Actinidia rufa]|uniref:DUF4283 domain-containing protein n=1 Tax=Actinidia rufa TaxID=165716 RepID=A0A7J0FFW3_9ERIC|nr:hypothetical protein Acr_11g0011030 [Actinidia rufa]